ncbi:MAG: YiiD C-terminal domain-containing protein [Gammaproteobacteria bacterium]
MTASDTSLCAVSDEERKRKDSDLVNKVGQDDSIFSDENITSEIRAAGDAFTQYLWAEIPICKQMEITAFPIHRERFILAAPLPPNRNVHGTAFAGSLYTVMSMSGWGLIRTELDRRLVEMMRARADLWLTKASIRYVDPVETAFHAVAELDGKSLDQFWNKLVLYRWPH